MCNPAQVSQILLSGITCFLYQHCLQSIVLSYHIFSYLYIIVGVIALRHLPTLLNVDVDVDLVQYLLSSMICHFTIVCEKFSCLNKLNLSLKAQYS